MLQLLARLLGRAPKSDLPPFNFALNRYKAKKHWPPNLRELTAKQQFRFERKFKRRLRLKSIKPQWQRWTKIVQWNLIGFVVIYGVLFHDFAKDPMNPRPGEQPFKSLRKWMWGAWDGMWTHTSSSLEADRAGAEPLSPSRKAAPEDAADAGGRKSGIQYHSVTNQYTTQN
ncbi:uncharacterized protein N0V89_003915 [Didymosphaeria variabile]|uniref:Uncharacterized protein n=1 Tax=Didymosphaeria variabile TaxID=1932322 RepID=A0A9W8XNH5_9PLEO|nr:uncharacterized protein N0V89_003915 [Didymosphaeria variabile]KAJ4355890.1 hypothetical protein N0V89_003915 [Didymosphaeria variabile]